MVEVDINKIVVYDIETLKNCFILCAKDYATGTKKEFIFYKDKKYANQPFELYKFLRGCVRNNYTMLGFNNIGFDAQILHLFYDWCERDVDKLYELDMTFIIDTLYKEAQNIIGYTEDERFTKLIYEGQLFIPQIDLFKQKHYDRPARATSLKWVQFTMRYPTIEDMPISHEEQITIDQVGTVLEYCWNDVDSTFAFFEKVKFETELRLQLGKEYGKNILNASEPRMVREIFGKFLCEELNMSYNELKKLRTIRKDVAFKDIIFPYTKYQTPQFKDVLQVFNNKIIDCNPHSKDIFKHTFQFQGMDVDLGLGGIHACVKSGIYEPKDDEILEDADGTSFYPMLAIKNDLRPEHLGKAFNKVYPMMFEERQKYPKTDPKNYVFKIILNSAFGLSKEINTYLYDPKLTYAITINGQLSLLMLVEALSLSVPNIKFLQMNTDGITYIYKKQDTAIVRKVCEWWEKVTRINLEYAYYNRMVIMDVNNYMAVQTNGKVKKKGLFETEIDFHKNPSYLIVAKTLVKYFTENINVAQTIRAHEDIYDFCGGIKRKSNFDLNLYRNFGGVEIVEPQQKVTRFIVSDEGGFLIKDFHDGRKVSALAETKVVPLNNIRADQNNAKEYKLNYKWYTNEVNKIVETIQPSVVQKELF